MADPAASIVPSETAAKGPQATGPPAARNPAEVVIITRALFARQEEEKGRKGVKT